MAAKKKEKKHWHCEGYVKSGCGGRGAKVSELKEGKAALEKKHGEMQAALDREIEAAKQKEKEHLAAVAKASEEAAEKAVKGAQAKIEKAHKKKPGGKAAPKGKLPAKGSPEFKKMVEQTIKATRKPGEKKPKKYT